MNSANRIRLRPVKKYNTKLINCLDDQVKYKSWVRCQMPEAVSFSVHAILTRSSPRIGIISAEKAKTTLKTTKTNFSWQISFPNAAFINSPLAFQGSNLYQSAVLFPEY